MTLSHVASYIDAIAAGTHADPFSVLGPHEGEVRAWLPQAREATLVVAAPASAGEVRMRRVHPDGFFTAPLPDSNTPYRIRVTLYSGEQLEFDDPYRFPPLLTPFELHLHGEGTNYESYRTLGAHLVTCEGVAGVRFAVWAPNAEVVTVTGDFNWWDRTRHPMRLRDGGIWEIFIPGIAEGAQYKYFVLARDGGQQDKCDPYGFF